MAHKTCKPKKLRCQMKSVYEKMVGCLQVNKCILIFVFLFWYSIFLSWQFFLNCVSKECHYSQMEIHLVSQEELSCHEKTKILARACQLFKLYCSIIQKLFCKYHTEVKLIIDGENFVVDFDRKFLFLY